MNHTTLRLIAIYLAILGLIGGIIGASLADDLDDWRNQSLRNQERQETYDYRLRETQRERAREWKRYERSLRTNEPVYTPRYIPDPNPLRREW